MTDGSKKPRSNRVKLEAEKREMILKFWKPKKSALCD